MSQYNLSPMTLLELLQAAGLTWRGSIEPISVLEVVSDSRQVQPGDVFVAWQGGTQDGHRFIDDAIENGAVAVVGTRSLSGLDVPYIQVANSQAALAWLSAARFGFPARRLTVIGVTGTDGKTTTTNLIYQILAQSGRRAGLISTVNAVIGSEVLDTGFHVTTPGAAEVQKYLAQMVTAGLSYAVLEATSHGLSQHRIDAAEFDIAVVTNITHEHLDYHGSAAAYRATKARLFEYLAETTPKPQGNVRLAVLNRDDESYAYLAGLAGENQISYGLSDEADLRAEQIESGPTGTHFVMAGHGFRLSMFSPLVGTYNVYNCLAAAAVCIHGLGMDLEAVRDGVAELGGIPGRMERLDVGQDFTAIVDFAHTPNALRRALETARQLTNGKVIAVFGSAGLRDREKRRLMAETAVQLADFSIFTAEDPRTESLDEILAEMALGAESVGGLPDETFTCVPDRGKALWQAVRRARSGDLVIACGKGHEQSMCFGEVEYPWDDRTAMRAALSQLLGVAGPDMPYLPTQEKVGRD